MPLEQVDRRPVNHTTQHLLNRYLDEKRSTGTISQRTHRELHYILDPFCDASTADPSKLTRRDVVRWMRTTNGLSANTRRQYYNRARCFCGWLQRRGVLAKDPFADLSGPRVPRPAHRALTPEQARALLGACVTTRETLVVVLGLYTGLRRSELVGLEVGDVDLRARTIHVRHGKGDEPRLLPLSAEACAVVARYLAVDGLRSGPLLRSHIDPSRGVAGCTIGDEFSALAFRAGVKVRAFDGVGAHSLRHSFASDVYEATSDVLAVRDLLGHASLATTAVYVRGFAVERLRTAVETLHYLDAA